MHIVRLLQTGKSANFHHILLVTCLAGLANATLLGIINQTAEYAVLGLAPPAQTLLMYICLFAFFYVADRASLREANKLVQRRLEALRMRVIDKLRRVDLRTLEGISEGEIFATVGQEMSHLSQSLPLLVNAAQSMFLLAFCLLYIATLSLVSFVVVTGFTLLGLLAFWYRRKSLNRDLTGVYRQEAGMMDSLSHFTRGFQEIRLNADKNDALFHHFSQVVNDLQQQVTRVGRKWVFLLQFSNAFLYALVGTVIFMLPHFFEGFTDVIYKITAAAIFCVGPVTAITAVAPLYTKADMGLAHMAQLEQRLSKVRTPKTQTAGSSRFAGFDAIACRDLRFSYNGDAAFTCGPLNLTLKRGETIFVVGGNGSGKSTAMKLLSGLYVPAGGEIMVDGVAVGEAERQDYRELFSAIFTDFHLFDRLYGLEQANPDMVAATVQALIALMELSGKVSYADGRFSTHDLSTGQRKRLAMIVSILEDREIYLFDEWAADQDARFRDLFYTKLLPELKRRGKTILAVTHDDRYWPRCDRLITMDMGAVISEKAGAA